MTSAISEFGSLIIDVFWKVITISMFLFVTSIIMKYNYYQRTNKWFVYFIIIFVNTSLFVFFFIWYLLGGLRGHFIPRGMPAFPYLYTQPKKNNVNYLVTPQGCDMKDFPRIPENKTSQSKNPFTQLWYFVFPPGNTDDTDIFNTNGNNNNENARVDKLIFGVRAGHTNPCDRSYLGTYRLNDWE